MILLIDMGNSRLKWATLMDEQISPIKSANYSEVPDTLIRLWKRLPVPEQAIISCVAGSEQWEQVQLLTRSLWGIEPVKVVSRAHKFGVTSSYDVPENLGSDRWVSLVATHHLYSGSTCCIVDVGTAITVDVILANGEHQGGIIIPGIKLMMESLVGGTAGIAEASKGQKLDDTLAFLGKDTLTGVSIGSWLAGAGAVEKIFSHMLSLYGDDILCILTGGGAQELSRYLSFDNVINEELLFKGLAVISTGKNMQ